MAKKLSKENKLVIKNYEDIPNERERLKKDVYHLLEYNTTMRFLKKYLPKKGHILDAGGGPGRYTIDLAKIGYNMTLMDIVSSHIQQAKQKVKKYKVQQKVKNIHEGSITDLSAYRDKTFDAVICLGGPLSHVHPASERQKAIKELIRVAKKGAPIFVSVIGFYGVLLIGPTIRPKDIADKAYFDKFIKTRDDYRRRGNGFCHFFKAEEFRKMFTKMPVKMMEMVGLEGLNENKNHINEFAKTHPKAWKNRLDMHYRTCTDPFVIDASAHMMIILKKK